MEYDRKMKVSIRDEMNISEILVKIKRNKCSWAGRVMHQLE